MISSGKGVCVQFGILDSVVSVGMVWPVRLLCILPGVG